MNISRLYVSRLYRHNRWACFVVLIFFGANFAANFISPTQLTPIYNWNLYAYPMPPQDTYDFFDIRYNNNQPLDIRRTWREPQRLMLTNTLAKYINQAVDKKPDWVQQHFDNSWKAGHSSFVTHFPNFRNHVTHVELKMFPSWFHRYLERYTGEKIDSIKVYRRQLFYTPQGRVQQQAANLMYTN